MKQNKSIDFDRCTLQPLSKEAVDEIIQWEYSNPYDVYNFKGCPNGYLLDESTWGTEQFALFCGPTIVAQVACQFEGERLWIGWSLAPAFCGNGNGHLFVQKCVQEIRKNKSFMGQICLKVAASNIRAIRAYQKAGFTYLDTIQDEIAYSDHIEDFWIMVI